MNFKKILVSSLLLAGIAVSPHALAAQSFDGHTINVAFEIWDSNDVLGGDDVLIHRRNEKDVLASDWTHPDEKDFYFISEDVDHVEWDIDFNQNRIELTFTSIKVKDYDHQYIYSSAKGFHFHDSDNSLPDIINVIVDPAFAPRHFHPELVTFDADNIYVNLKGSMCLNSLIPVAGSTDWVPECDNARSPTGFNNRIILRVEFAVEEGAA